VTIHALRLAIPGRLEPTDLVAGSGEMIAVVGPNGGGKTSLLRALAAIESTEGDVRVDGESLRAVSHARRQQLVGFHAASRHLAWPIAVRDLLLLGLSSPQASDIARPVEALELAPLLDRAATTLSTGERARVLLARALVAAPRLIIADEPLANLDPYWAIRVMDILSNEARDRGATVVMALPTLSELPAFDRPNPADGRRALHSETPARLVGMPAFEKAFRITLDANGQAVRRPADPRSSP